MASICSALYIQMAKKNKADIAWKMDPLLRLTPPRCSAMSSSSAGLLLPTLQDGALHTVNCSPY